MSAGICDWRRTGIILRAGLVALALVANAPVVGAAAHGPRLVADINPGRETSGAIILGALDDAIYLRAKDGVHGDELWATAGTAASTRLVADLVPGAQGSIVGAIGRLNDAFFILGLYKNTGQQLWKVRADDSVELLRNVFPLPGVGHCEIFGPAAGALLLMVAGDETGCEPWLTDGTAAGTFLLRDIEPQGGSFIRRGLEFAGHYFFPAYNHEFGEELWRTDGTPEGTRLVADIAPGGASSWPGGFAIFRGSLYFAAADTTTDPLQAALWRITDPTAPPHVAVNLERGGVLVAAESMIYFQAEEDQQGIELWRTDGTPAGTTMVRDICRGQCSSVSGAAAQGWRTLGDTVFFPAVDHEGAIPRLWASDGTAATTRAFEGPTDPTLLAVAGDRIVFSAMTESEGRELWVSDGTPAGTFLVGDIAPGRASSDPGDFFVHGDQLFFTADDGVVGHELWVVPLADLREPPPATPTPSPTPAPPCTGDCDGNAVVTVEEIVRAVRIALGTTPLEQCLSADADGSAGVEVPELVRAVRNALEGCR